jgi:hypothetical protein
VSKLVKPKHGHGWLRHGGRKKGAKQIISRTFKEVSEMLLTDPDVQDALKRRVLLELAGRKRNPLPLVAVLAAAAQGEKAKEGSQHGAVTFAVQIVAGRGVVEKIEGPDAPALPEAAGEGDTLDAQVVTPTGERGSA